MYLLWNCYIATLCVSCSKHYIVETKDEASVTVHDDIKADIKADIKTDIDTDIKTDLVYLYNEGGAGDYSVERNCNGIRLLCNAPKEHIILEDTCIFT